MDRQLQRHQRRFSSTPIKLPPTAPPRCSSSDGLRRSSSSDSRATVTNGLNVGVEEDDCSESEDNHETPDVSSCGSSEFGDQEFVVKPPPFPSTLPCFPAAANPPYDKRAYEGGDRESASRVMQGVDGESFPSDTDDSTLMEDKESQQARLVFDDDDTWSHAEDATDDTGSVTEAAASGVPPQERMLTRKVAASKAVELDTGVVDGSANQTPDPPPCTSQLMTRLFPSLKPKAQNAPLPPPSVAPEPRNVEEAPGERNSN